MRFDWSGCAALKGIDLRQCAGESGGQVGVDCGISRGGLESEHEHEWYQPRMFFWLRFWLMVVFRGAVVADADGRLFGLLPSTSIISLGG